MMKKGLKIAFYLFFTKIKHIRMLYKKINFKNFINNFLIFSLKIENTINIFFLLFS